MLSIVDIFHILVASDVEKPEKYLIHLSLGQMVNFCQIEPILVYKVLQYTPSLNKVVTFFLL